MKRKRGHQPSSEEGRGEHRSDDAPPRKNSAAQHSPGCSVEGCRNPVAGCPDLAMLGVCWFHGEDNNRLQGDEVVSSPTPRRNPMRVGRATEFNEPEMVVSAQNEMRSLSCSREACTKIAQRGGIYRKHGGKQIRRTCRHDGCTNKVQSGGVCKRHGAEVKTCSHEGCTNKSLNGGVCIRHGANNNHKRCSLAKDAPILSSKEVYANGMGQR